MLQEGCLSGWPEGKRMEIDEFHRIGTSSTTKSRLAEKEGKAGLKQLRRGFESSKITMKMA